MSKPQWLQKFASSAATADRPITGAISSHGTQSFSIPPSRQASPSWYRLIGGGTMLNKTTSAR